MRGLAEGAFLVIALPHSDAFFGVAIPKQLTDTFWEYIIRVLRLLEKHSLENLAVPVGKRIRMRAHTREAIAQFLLPAESREQTTTKTSFRRD